MSDPSCSIHGTEHVRAVRVSPQLLGHRCAAEHTGASGQGPSDVTGTTDTPSARS